MERERISGTKGIQFNWRISQQKADELLNGSPSSAS